MTPPAISTRPATAGRTRPAPRLPTRTRLATAAGLLVLASLSATATAQGRHETVVQTSTAVPGAAGQLFNFIGTSLFFNDAGQVAVQSFGSDSSPENGVFRYANGTLTPIALGGQAAPGTASGVFKTISSYSMNSLGQIGFSARIDGDSLSDEGVYGSGGSFGSLAPIALAGPGASLTGIASISPMNNSGQILIDAFALDGSSSGEGRYLYRTGGTAWTTIAQVGQSAPGFVGGELGFMYGTQLNASGQATFLSNISTGPNDVGLYRGSGGGITPVAVTGQVAPGAGGARFQFLFSNALNNAGQSMFTAQLENSDGSITSGVFLSNPSGTALSTLAVGGQAAPVAGGGTFLGASGGRLNQAGQVAFAASLSGGSIASGVFLSSPGTAGLKTMARSGQTAPETGGGVFWNGPFLHVRLHDSGLVSFHAGVTGGNTSGGLFLTDGRETVAAQRVGQQVGGRTVRAFGYENSSGLEVLGDSELNRHGQLAYYVLYEGGGDGGNGVHVFTPDLRWRETFSGGWDTSEHWTLGLTPAAVHELRIDPDTALTVTGPAGAVDVRALTVGGGAGVATLRLAGGTLGSANAVQVASNGVLTGRGTVSAEVVNAGEVRADNLVLAGGLLNRGVVRGAATGDARLETNLTNAGGGVVRTEAGQTLELVGSAHTNVGRIEVQGAMLVRGTLDNKEDGLIGLDGGRADFSDGLSNRGVLQVETGGAQLFGPIDNLAGGRITFTGNSTSTVNGALRVLNGAELRVAPGSTVQFFGPVDQATGSVFSGGGNKFYGGGLSVGDSPGFGRDAGNVRFGAGNVYLAEIGGTRACTLACAGNPALADLGFDKYVVDGTLILGGTLRLVSWAGMVAQEGDSFDLFDWGTLQGRFDSIDASGLTLAAGTLLDFSRLYTTGEVGVTAVPEPGTWGLMAAGLLVLGRRLRRRLAH
jgi:hypothetical protein